MEQSDLFKTVHETPMDVDTSVHYRNHSEDSLGETGDSNEYSSASSEDNLPIKTENKDEHEVTEDLSLNMSRLQITPPIDAEVIVNGNKSRLETILEQNEPQENIEGESEGRLSEDDGRTQP